MRVNPDFSKRVSLPPDVLIRRVEDESVILNLENGRYFGLDDMGTRMLETLRESASIQEAFDALLARYDVEPEFLEGDLRGLLDKLLESGVVELLDR